jgi:hypothetical protein
VRNIITVTNQILTILSTATIAPGDQDNVTTLQAELRVLLRRASYTPPEASQTAALWLSLGQALYRYLPPASGGYAAQISVLVTGSTGTAK